MFFQDLRYGFRTALKNKGVTGLAVICLAIGIGLNTMMFSVTDGVLIQPLPYQDPDGLIALHTTQKQLGIRRGSLSWLDLKDWQERSRSFSTIGAVQQRSFTVSDGKDPERYLGAAVSYDLFAMLGKAPQIGRVLQRRRRSAGRRTGRPARRRHLAPRATTPTLASSVARSK